MTHSLTGSLRSSLGLLFLLLAPSGALAQLGAGEVLDAHEPEGALPDFDIRYVGDQPAEFVVEALQVARSSSAIGRREEALKELELKVPALSLDMHALFGTPHFLRSTATMLADAPNSGATDSRSVVVDFLTKHEGLFELKADELRSGRVTRSYGSGANGVNHWTLLQQFRGLDVFEGELRANVTAAGELINLSSAFLPTPEDGFRVSDFRIDPRSAVEIALGSVGRLDVRVDLEDGSGWPNAASWQSSSFERPVTVRRLYFPLSRLELRAAYHVNLAGLGGLSNYRLIIDAATGQTLWRWNAILHYGGTEDATFRVFTDDNPNPMSPGLITVGNTFPAPAMRQLVTVTGASVAGASPLGWIDDGVNTTTGNNCLAHTDLSGTNTPDPRPVGSPYRVFDLPMDLTQQPSAYSQASAVNLFYWGNLYHDRLHAAGFDEPSGNFQAQNFGNGGAGNDPMLLDAQDGADTNNARYFHASEGVSARIEMYTFTGPSPDHDGSLDSDVVFHELAHGTSLRLIGSLGTHQSAGMGEGWSDFVGLALNAKVGDDPNANYPAGPYASSELNGLPSSYYFGIRRFPYTTDLNKNPLTFADIDPGQFAIPPAVPSSPIINLGNPSAIHQVGEVWCVSLWDCRANLVATHGFAGNEIMLRLVIEGMKLTPFAPNFIQARDAILQADLVTNGGANLADLWAGFAKRGLGDSATSPGSNSVAGVVEAFDVPPGLFFSYPNGRPTQLLPNQVTEFEVRVTGTNMPLAGSGQLFYRVNGGSFVNVFMTETLLGEYTASLPGFSCFDLIEYSFSASDSLATYLDPETAPTELFSAQVYESTSDVLVEDFETNLGWTVSSTASDGQWSRGLPQGNGRGDPAADFDGSGSCWLSDIDPSSTNSDIDNGSTTLTSPSMDLSSGATVSYAYWFNDIGSGQLSGGDSFDVEVATNAAGTNWTQVRSYSTASDSWRTDSIAVGTEVLATSTMRFRFTASDINNQNVVEAGLDAFAAVGFDCVGTGTDVCFGDGGNQMGCTNCPCANGATPGTVGGCLNSSGQSARLIATGDTSVSLPSGSADDLRFGLTGAPANAFCILNSGDALAPGNMANPCFGTGSGAQAAVFDGLRCAITNTRRHGGRSADLAGTVGVTNSPWGGEGGPPVGIAQAGPGFVSGQTRYFQVINRDDPLLVCMRGLNTSQGVEVTFAP